MDDVDLRPPRGEEHDGIERRNVDAFGETLRVGEDAALARRRVLLQPPDVGAAATDLGGTVDVAGRYRQGSDPITVGTGFELIEVGLRHLVELFCEAL